jgi:RNA polymerase sigma factor (sigma-70 family)
MEPSSAHLRLSRIETLWTVVCQAHADTAAAGAAQEQLLRRYDQAVRRYLLGALRDADAADDLAQEFALRFVRGDLHRADPGRGRFRDYVKGVLFHLISHHHRRKRRAIGLIPEDVDPAAPDSSPQEDSAFLESWRTELLDRAWKALAAHDKESGRPFHAVLRLRVDRPALRSTELAEELRRQMGRPVTAAWVRQNLHRAREKFADLLVLDVLQTLHNPTVDRLEEELVEIGLLEYCRPAVDRLRIDR